MPFLKCETTLTATMMKENKASAAEWRTTTGRMTRRFCETTTTGGASLMAMTRTLTAAAVAAGGKT